MRRLACFLQKYVLAPGSLDGPRRIRPVSGELEDHRNYRTAIEPGISITGASRLRLSQESPATSLCGIPWTKLTDKGMFDELVCSECIEWPPTCAALAGRHRKLERG